MIFLQSAVNEATFEVLYNALIKTKLSIGCVSCCKNFIISSDVINVAKVT